MLSRAMEEEDNDSDYIEGDATKYTKEKKETVLGINETLLYYTQDVQKVTNSITSC